MTIPGKSWAVFRHSDKQLQSICWDGVRLHEDVLVPEITRPLKNAQWNCQSNPEEQTPSRRHNSPRLQAILESHSHQTVWYWYQNKQTEQSYRVENPERNPNTYSQLIFDKGGKNIKWKRVFSANCSWETWTAA